MASKSEPEVGDGAEERRDRDERVESAAATPADDRAADGADRERDERREAHECHRPDQRLADHLGHGPHAVEQRDAEVAAQEHAPVVEVLLPERRVGVEAEQRAQRFGRLGCDIAVAGEVRTHRIALHHAGQEEVDRDRGPQREQVEEGASADEAPRDARVALDGAGRRRARLDRVEVLRRDLGGDGAHFSPPRMPAA